MAGIGLLPRLGAGVLVFALFTATLFMVITNPPHVPGDDSEDDDFQLQRAAPLAPDNGAGAAPLAAGDAAAPAVGTDADAAADGQIELRRRAVIGGEHEQQHAAAATTATATAVDGDGGQAADADGGATDTGAHHAAGIEPLPPNSQRAPPPAAAASAISLPHSLDDLHHLAKRLARYQHFHPSYVFTVFVLAYLWKQTFSIPGSVFLNILGGALFGPLYGFLLCSTLTAVGATMAFLLSTVLLCPVIDRVVPSSTMHSLRRRLVSDDRSELLLRLVSLRVFPGSPNWLINLVSPAMDIPLQVFSVSVFLGLAPYNFICTQGGAVLSTIKSVSDVLSFQVMLKMAALAALLVGFSIWRKRNAQPPLQPTSHPSQRFRL